MQPTRVKQRHIGQTGADATDNAGDADQPAPTRPRQTPTPAQEMVLQNYDVPPYVPAQSAGAILFIDLAGQYVASGAGYDAGALQGMSAEQVAAALSDPSSAASRAILGQATPVPGKS